MKLFSIKSINPRINRNLVTSQFGWRKHPITNKLQYHNGIDIALPEGTPLFAPHDAQMEWSFHAVGGLQCVLYWKSENLKIRVGFAHCSWVDQGKKIVKKGDLAARVGNTGKSTGPHLHLTVATWSRDGWVFLNPLEVLDGWI
ncbi:MAG: M23 family metallopeptidase [Sulfolobales archaeon]